MRSDIYYMCANTASQENSWCDTKLLVSGNGNYRDIMSVQSDEIENILLSLQ